MGSVAVVELRSQSLVGRRTSGSHARHAAPPIATARSVGSAGADPLRPARLVPAVVALTAAVLVASAAWPAPVAPSAPAAPSPVEVAVPAAPSVPGVPFTDGDKNLSVPTGVDVGLPGTGEDAATSATDADLPVTTTGVPASRCAAPCSTSQVISVRILPGSLSVDAPSAVVSLVAGDDGTAVGQLEDVVVTDLRGAGSGWGLAATVTSAVDAAGRAVPGVTVELQPRCTKLAGPLTLEPADPAVVPVGGTTSLCRVPVASSGSLAGGVVRASADVVVRGAPAGAVLRLSLALAAV